ncbi:MAG: helix-turn-helix domain-containing protein [Acidimicrobiales bacterium]
MKTDRESIAGGLVAEARILAGLSQRELARRAGTSAAAVANYENGRQQPRFDTLVRLIEAAGFELRCRVELPDEQDRLYRQWEATVSRSSLEDWYERLGAGPS